MANMKVEGRVNRCNLRYDFIYGGVCQRPGLSILNLPGSVTINLALNDVIGLPEIFSMACPDSAYTLTGDAGR